MSELAKVQYEVLAHAIQSAVALEMSMKDININDPYGNAIKHLRTGLNLVIRDHASLAKLLIKKGIITRPEYEDAILAGLKEELEMLEKMHGVKFG